MTRPLVNLSEQQIKQAAMSETTLRPSLESLVMDDAYDWDCLGDRGINMRTELPLMSDRGIQEVQDEILRLSFVMKPASDVVIAKRLSLLNIRYYSHKEQLNQAVIDRLVLEDLSDAKKYPGVQFIKACEKWRANPSNRFGPKSVAELMESTMHEVKGLKKRYSRLRTLVHHTQKNRQN